MKIIEIQIKNFRNLDGINISLAEDCNFIVGENNLGKSNLLTLLNIIFTSRTFRFEDFHDPAEPIEIIFRLKLGLIEIGHFQDLFDVDDYSIINIAARQLNTDDNINFYHLETDAHISSQVVKCINYIYYDSLRNPVSEINFDKGKGAGRFLRNIISKYLEINEISNSDFLNETNINLLIDSINQKISKIKSFQDFGIIASGENDVENLLSKIVILNDSKGDSLMKSGYGVQFLILITLSILEKLQNIQQQRGDRGIFEDESTGTKSISLVLGLDEPEIHLHPYMQRSLIKYLNSLINNNNPDFKQLVKELFGIDEFIGQIMVVTHSPNIILNDYRQIIRFYTTKGVTKVVSGSELSLHQQLQKHLYLHFPFIKEAFFSRCAIFVEGDSEYASFPYFAQKLSIEFDDLGICVIQSRGDAIPQLIWLAEKFGIRSVGVTDKDDGKKTATMPNLLQTDHRDFEEELISLVDCGNEEIIRNILCEYDSKGIEREMTKETLNARVRKYNVVSKPYTSSLKLADIPKTDIPNLKAYYLTWYSINKSYPLGKMIGEMLDKDDIPAIYTKVIRIAEKLANDV